VISSDDDFFSKIYPDLCERYNTPLTDHDRASVLSIDQREAASASDETDISNSIHDFESKHPENITPLKKTASVCDTKPSNPSKINPLSEMRSMKQLMRERLKKESQ
jgi:hypothetical protein